MTFAADSVLIANYLYICEGAQGGYKSMAGAGGGGGGGGGGMMELHNIIDKKS